MSMVFVRPVPESPYENTTMLRNFDSLRMPHKDLLLQPVQLVQVQTRAYGHPTRVVVAILLAGLR
jgi:hypothetical protein